MAIPEQQLQTWSNYGAQAAAAAMYKSVGLALSKDKPPLDKWNFEVYLQGSYRNDTNIRADSDVDIVVQLNREIWKLPALSNRRQVDQYTKAIGRVLLLWHRFRLDVLKALVKYFGVIKVDDSGNNSLKVKGDDNRLNADVIPCLLYYRQLPILGSYAPTPGIQYFTKQGHRIVINYPKAHYGRGVIKNRRTRQRFKPTVRMFKNARKNLVGSNSIDKDLAASYFIQCLIYNVPDEMFVADFQSTYFNVLNWLRSCNLSSFKCQNGQTDLFGNTEQHWSLVNAEEFINALIDLWNDW